MCARTWTWSAVAVLVTLWAAEPLTAEVLSIAGSASVEIREYRAGLPGEIDEASDGFPETSGELPLQVVARLADVAEEVAGSVAAQFADPLTSEAANPEEFAVNLALNSLSPETYYTAAVTLEELRGVRYSAEELSPAADGETVDVQGEFFLDGALAVFANVDVDDLSGVSLKLRITIVKEGDDLAPVQVYSGVLEVSGREAGELRITASGAFPDNGVLDTDLSSIDEELGVFRVLVLPALVIDYTYGATIGQAFDLRATVEVEAANAVGGVGVAAILGTPIDTLQEVISLTRDEAAAEKMTAALQQERAAPTGAPAFRDEIPVPAPVLFPACGLLGWEMWLGLVGLAGMRVVASGRRVAR